MSQEEIDQLAIDAQSNDTRKLPEPIDHDRNIEIMNSIVALNTYGLLYKDQRKPRINMYQVLNLILEGYWPKEYCYVIFEIMKEDYDNAELRAKRQEQQAIERLEQIESSLTKEDIKEANAIYRALTIEEKQAIKTIEDLPHDRLTAEQKLYVVTQQDIIQKSVDAFYHRYGADLCQEALDLANDGKAMDAIALLRKNKLTISRSYTESKRRSSKTAQ